MNKLLAIALFAVGASSPLEAECPKNPALPIYPQIAIAARVQGVVELQVSVDEAGRVSSVSVDSGHPMLRQAALDAIKQWVFPDNASGQERTRSFKSRFIYHLSGADQGPRSIDCPTARVLIELPNVEIWAGGMVVQP